MTNHHDAVDRRRVITPWKALEVGAAVVAVIVWLTSIFLWMYYDSARPRIADPGIGRIYRLNTHGSIVYLTRGEHVLLKALMLMGGVCFVAAVCIDIFKKPFRPR